MIRRPGEAQHKAKLTYAFSKEKSFASGSHVPQDHISLGLSEIIRAQTVLSQEIVKVRPELSCNLGGFAYPSAA